MAVDLNAVAPKLADFISARAQVDRLQALKAQQQSILAKINDDLAAAQATLTAIITDLKAAGL